MAKPEWDIIQIQNLGNNSGSSVNKATLVSAIRKEKFARNFWSINAANIWYGLQLPLLFLSDAELCHVSYWADEGWWLTALLVSKGWVVCRTLSEILGTCCILYNIYEREGEDKGVCVLKISKEQRDGGNTYTVIQASREHKRLFFWLERQSWACEQGIAWCGLIIPRSTKWDFLWALFKKIKKPATLEVFYSIMLLFFFSTGMQKNLDSVYTLTTMDNSIFSVSGV